MTKFLVGDIIERNSYYNYYNEQCYLMITKLDQGFYHFIGKQYFTNSWYEVIEQYFSLSDIEFRLRYQNTIRL